MSEPQSSGALAVEMAGLDVIPESDRKGKPSDLFMPWFAANISVLGISWGSWVLGFGLSLAQALVSAQGGTLRASNNPAGGAHFEIAFPKLVV